MRTRALAIGAGVLLAALVVPAAALLLESPALVSTRHDLCGDCGSTRSTRTIAGIPCEPRVHRDETARWMLSLHGAEHEHDWVLSHTTWVGGIGCAMPPEREALLALERAHARVGSDPAIAALVRSLPGASAVGRAEIARAADALGR